MARRGAREQSADRLDGLTIAADDPADVRLAHLHPENGGPSVRDFGKHDLVGEFDKLANDELEELLHREMVAAVCVRGKALMRSAERVTKTAKPSLLLERLRLRPQG